MTDGDEPFKLPTIEETVTEILSEQDTGGGTGESHMTSEPSHMSTSYCLLYLDANRTGMTRHFPAYDCEHILLNNSTVSSGYYWIDPNLGCSADAIRVYCNFSSNETCVFPTDREVG